MGRDVVAVEVIIIGTTGASIVIAWGTMPISAGTTTTTTTTVTVVIKPTLLTHSSSPMPNFVKKQLSIRSSSTARYSTLIVMNFLVLTLLMRGNHYSRAKAPPPAPTQYS